MRPETSFLSVLLLVASTFVAPSAVSASGDSQEPRPSLFLGHVVMNEFEQDPPGDDRRGGEFVELFNPTSQSVDIGKWIIYTTHGDISSHEIPAGTLIAAGAFWQVTFTDQFIDNGEDSLVLLNALGQPIDQTPSLGDTNDDVRSWQRYPDGSDNWIFADPSTSGATNIPEYPSPAMLASGLLIATVLLLRRKRNVVQSRRL